MQHEDYEARETAAWLIGQLGSRGQLGEQIDAVIDELAIVANRPCRDEGKETQANPAAVIALGKIGHRGGFAVLRRILFSAEWEHDDLQHSAAEVLGMLVNESFLETDDPVQSARAFLNADSRWHE